MARADSLSLHRCQFISASHDEEMEDAACCTVPLSELQEDVACTPDPLPFFPPSIHCKAPPLCQFVNQLMVIAG